jgi:hypothetical protein
MPLGAFRQSLNLANPVAAVVPSLTFVASSFQTTTSNFTITIPATAAVGDIAILFDRQNTPSAGFVTPTGWTTIATRFVSTNKVNISYKVLTAGDPGLTITGQGTTARKIMAVYRPSQPINSVTVVTNSQGGNTSATTTGSSFGGFGNLTQDLTAQTQRPILAYAFWSQGAVSTFTRTSTLTAEREITDGGGFTWVRMFVFNPSSSTSTVNTISTGTGSAASVKFQFEGSLRLS